MKRNEESGDAGQKSADRERKDAKPVCSVKCDKKATEPTQSDNTYEVAKYLDDLMRDMHILETIQLTYPDQLCHTYSILAKEINRVSTILNMQTARDEQTHSEQTHSEQTHSEQTHSEQTQQSNPDAPSITVQEKIMIQNRPNSKIIGRILGPRGISVKQLEAQTGCRILIRGKGSVKDSRREARLRNRVGWEHLSEPLHVLVAATDVSHERCIEKLAVGVECVKALLNSNDDEHKRRQLVQLAIINGTYRPMPSQE